MTVAVSHPAERNAPLSVTRSLPVNMSYCFWLDTRTPDWNVACAIQLPPPAIGEVSHPLRAEYPAAASLRVPSSSVGTTIGAIRGSSIALRP